jgi:hypothetical protein
MCARAVLLLGAACSSKSSDDQTQAPIATSGKAAVRFKRVARLSADFAHALALAPEQLCTELGKYPCGAVHSVALGGVDPYATGLYEPLPFTGASSPMAVDRMALAACAARVTMDLAAPAQAAIFRIGVDAGGQMRLDDPAVARSIDELHRRTLLRDATTTERALLKQLYLDVVATHEPEPARAWMKLACFVTLSSVESLFY